MASSHYEQATEEAGNVQDCVDGKIPGGHGYTAEELQVKATLALTYAVLDLAVALKQNTRGRGVSAR